MGVTVVVVMGVSGSGKSTVGTALAAALGVDYAEADTFHPGANIRKMGAGRPLDDADRAPWLAAIADWIGGHACSGGVVSSSALKRRYRDVLRSSGTPVFFLHLHGPRDVLAERMAARSGHFMPGTLLGSQLADLEPLQRDEAGMTMDIRRPPAEIVAGALTGLTKGKR